MTDRTLTSNAKLATAINRIEQWADGLQYYVSQTWRRDVAEAGLDGLPEEPGLIAEAIRDDMVVVLRLLRTSDETLPPRITVMDDGRAMGGSDVCHTCAAHCTVINDLETALRGLYWDNVDYLTLNKLGGMQNHWMRAARMALGMDVDDVRPTQKASEQRTAAEEWENAKAVMSGEMPPCECTLRDKAPSAYHNAKCPRYVADKL